jgi:hypothetical protein
MWFMFIVLKPIDLHKLPNQINKQLISNKQTNINQNLK